MTAPARVEAWSLPGVGTFERKVPTVPYVNLQYGDANSEIVWSSIRVPREEVKTLIDIDSGYATLLRVFEEDEAGTWTNVQSFYAESVTYPFGLWADVVQVSGPIAKGILEHGSLYPSDWEGGNTVTESPDWIFGGANVLSNPDFEESQTVNERYKIELDGATSGTFTLTVGGETTSSINIATATVTDIENALQGLDGTPDVIDVVVWENGDGWDIEFVDPAILDTNMTWVPTSFSGGGGGHDLTVTEEGSDYTPVAWTKSQHPDATSDPQLHGTYASLPGGFGLVDTPVEGGGKALSFNGLTQYAGAQQVPIVTPNTTYQASIYINPVSASDKITFVIRDAAHPFNVLAEDRDFTLTASTYTQRSIADVVIPTGVEAVIYRVAYTGTGNPLPIRLDTAALNIGFAPAKGGAMFTDLWTSVTDRSHLDWIKVDSWSDTQDSGGTNWTDDLSLTFPVGMSMAQVLAVLKDYGIEHDFKWNSGTSEFELLLYEDGTMGGDLTGTAFKIYANDLLQGGDITEQIPEKNAWLLECFEGALHEASNSGLVTSFGRREGYSREDLAVGTDTLTVRGAELSSEADDQKYAIIARLGPEFTPTVTAEIGSLVDVELGPDLPDLQLRIWGWTVTWDDRGNTTRDLTFSYPFFNESGGHAVQPGVIQASQGVSRGGQGVGAARPLG